MSTIDDVMHRVRNPQCLIRRSDAALLVAEIRRLRAIVDKLPKTADGKVVLWGDTVWSTGLHEWTVTGIGQDGLIEVANARGSRFWRLASDHWSTRDAAEAEGGGG